MCSAFWFGWMDDCLGQRSLLVLWVDDHYCSMFNVWVMFTDLLVWDVDSDSDPVLVQVLFWALTDEMDRTGKWSGHFECIWLKWRCGG